MPQPSHWQDWWGGGAPPSSPADWHGWWTTPLKLPRSFDIAAMLGANELTGAMEGGQATGEAPGQAYEASGQQTGAQPGGGFDTLGGHAPSLTALGVDGVGKAAIAAALAGIGPFGTAVGSLNSFANAFNTNLNVQAAKDLGYNPTTGQIIGGAMGFNGYAGTYADLYGAMVNNDNSRSSIAQFGPNATPGQVSQTPVSGQPSMPDTTTAPRGSVTTTDLAAPPGTAPAPSTAGYAAALAAQSASEVGSGSDAAGGGGGGGSDPGGGGQEGAGQGANNNAAGGIIHPANDREMAPAHLGGLIDSPTPGRADALRYAVPVGSFILPADVVSALGDGNTEAGARLLDHGLSGGTQGGAHGRQMALAHVSGGEYVVPPERVQALGGAAALQGLVDKARAQRGQATSPAGFADGGEVGADPNDFTDRYNTALPQEQESAFQSWLQQSGKAKDLYDYDMRGAWATSAQAASNGHLPDTFKKPNHPTFSTGSKYHGSDGNVGGEWVQAPNGSWDYRASPTNLKLFGADNLLRYFQRVEPGNRLVMPGSSGGSFANGGEVLPPRDPMTDNPVGTERVGQQSLTMPTPFDPPVKPLLGPAGSQAYADRVNGIAANALAFAPISPVVGGANALMSAGSRGHVMEPIPRYWYHGTDGAFDAFDSGRFGWVSSGHPEGVWLTKNLQYASEYAQNAAAKGNGEPNIMHVESQVKRPLVVAFDDAGKLKNPPKGLEDATDNADVIKYAKSNGYDSVYWVDSTFTDDGATLTVLHPDSARVLQNKPANIDELYEPGSNRGGGAIR